VAFSGGEPLIRRDLGELISFVRSYKIPSIVTTNGILLTETRIHELIAAGATTFQIPLHSHLEDMHDFLSSGRCWRHSLEAMMLVRESGASLVPVFVATSLNVQDFPRVLRILAHLGVRRVIFNKFIPTGLGTINEKAIGIPQDAELVQLLSAANDFAESASMVISLGTPIQGCGGVEYNWKNIELSSCPVQSGQSRWTLSSDLRLRRCNQSGSDIGSVLGVGLDRLLEELRLAKTVASSINPCALMTKRKVRNVSGQEWPEEHSDRL